MDESVFREIANEIKGLHNGAFLHINQKEYEEAALLYNKALQITEKIFFHEGTALTLYNMANLSLCMGNFVDALKNAACARDMFIKAGKPCEDCEKLLSQLAESVKKRGIEYEKKGKFKEAIEHYEMSIPFAGEKSRRAMEHEVSLLKRVMDRGYRKPNE